MPDDAEDRDDSDGPRPQDRLARDRRRALTKRMPDQWAIARGKKVR